MMEDVQNHPDNRHIPINRVGVSGLNYPITIFGQSTIATLSMSVNLPHYFRGTHMSRFIEVLNDHRSEVTPDILHDLMSRLQSDSAYIKIQFPYFLERTAPVSQAKAMMNYDCSFVGKIDKGQKDFILSVRVPVTSLCPCSKAISEYGAHNQRGCITIEIRSKDDLTRIEDIVEVAEQSASAPIFTLLKREDERFLTMRAYENPAFVEDIVRNVSIALQKNSTITWFRVLAENQESIHNHNAFAEIIWP